MSIPRSLKEIEQARQTEAVAGPTENLVSTACPECDVRFAMLAKFDAAGWYLRCTLCGCRAEGELKQA